MSLGWKAFLLGLVASIVLVQSYGHFHQAQHFQIHPEQAGWVSEQTSSDDQGSNTELHDCALLDAISLGIALTDSSAVQVDSAQFASVKTPKLATALSSVRELAIPPARAPPVSV